MEWNTNENFGKMTGRLIKQLEKVMDRKESGSYIVASWRKVELQWRNFSESRRGRSTVYTLTTLEVDFSLSHFACASEEQAKYSTYSMKWQLVSYQNLTTLIRNRYCTIQTNLSWLVGQQLSIDSTRRSVDSNRIFILSMKSNYVVSRLVVID